MQKPGWSPWGSRGPPAKSGSWPGSSPQRTARGRSGHTGPGPPPNRPRNPPPEGRKFPPARCSRWPGRREPPPACGSPTRLPGVSGSPPRPRLGASVAPGPPESPAGTRASPAMRSNPCPSTPPADFVAPATAPPAGVAAPWRKPPRESASPGRFPRAIPPPGWSRTGSGWVAQGRRSAGWPPSAPPAGRSAGVPQTGPLKAVGQPSPHPPRFPRVGPVPTPRLWVCEKRRFPSRSSVRSGRPPAPAEGSSVSTPAPPAPSPAFFSGES